MLRSWVGRRIEGYMEWWIDDGWIGRGRWIEDRMMELWMHGWIDG